MHSHLVLKDSSDKVSFSLFPIQHLSPLELVKAARRAAGDSASKEITEDELWGDNVSKSGSNPSATQVSAI